jgi:hypothetical protein
MFSSDLTSSSKTRRQTAGWGNLSGPLSQPDRDYLEYKAGQPQGSYISDDYGRTQHLLGQDNAMRRGRGIAGPATRALSRGGYDDGGGMTGRVPQSGAMNALLADKSDVFQNLAIDDILDQRAARARDLARPTADQELFSGMAGARQRATGDIMRGEHIANAGAEGQAEAARYFAPGQNDRRRQAVWDQEYSQQRLTPFSKEAVRGEYDFRAAAERAAAQRAAAEAQGNSRTGSAAINALQRNTEAGAFANSPEQQQAISRTEAAILPNVPGQSRMGPGDPGKVFPAAKLESFARQNGMSPQQAQEYLTRIAGYRIQ